VPGPLAGIRIVDLTSTFLGPYCTMQLGDLGADIIKVEPPQGDITRYLGVTRDGSLSSLFTGVNRGKRSVVLDLKQPEGQAALDRVLATSDVLVHNMRPAAAARLGLSDERLRRARPQLIHCVATGFGSDGPYAERPAYDDIVQAASGIAALQGSSTGTPDYVRTVIADKTVGLMAAGAITAALFHRERTGEGQRVEVPMFETMVSYLLVEQLGGLTYEPAEGPSGYARTASPDRRPYRTADGYLAVVVYTERQWQNFLTHVGRAAMLEDPRYATVVARSRHIDELYAIVAAELATATTAEWLEVLEGLDVPAMPVRTIEELFDDPHLAAVGMFGTVDYPEGTVRTVRSPVRFSQTPTVTGRAPRLGEHSLEVLRAAGVEEDRIATLVGAGATAAAPDPPSTTHQEERG
jgi:crotonobetainyl-CoA:carnitine CoA-transferase CaiB-like acyl-CoA transferase